MKVVSMVPSLTETLLWAGVNVVGRTRFCIHPQQKVKDIAIVGGTKEVDWNKVKELNADLIILDKEENPKSMSEQTVIPFFATHFESIQTSALELQNLSLKLNNPNLFYLSEKINQLTQKKYQFDINNIPGLIKYLKKPEHEIKSILYVIWRNPWMVVSQDTYIGSMLSLLGYEKYLTVMPNKYQKIEIERLDKNSTLLLFSSEPFPFAKFEEQILDMGFPSALVDGECYSWFGVRSANFLSKLFET